MGWVDSTGSSSKQGICAHGVAGGAGVISPSNCVGGKHTQMPTTASRGGLDVSALNNGRVLDAKHLCSMRSRRLRARKEAVCQQPARARVATPTPIQPPTKRQRQHERALQEQSDSHPVESLIYMDSGVVTASANGSAIAEPESEQYGTSMMGSESEQPPLEPSNEDEDDEENEVQCVFDELEDLEPLGVLSNEEQDRDINLVWSGWEKLDEANRIIGNFLPGLHDDLVLDNTDVLRMKQSLLKAMMR